MTDDGRLAPASEPSGGLVARLRSIRDDAIVRRLIARAGPNTVASLVGAILGMIRSAILVRALGIVDFGQFAVIVSATAIVRQAFSVRTWEWTTVELAVAQVRMDAARLRAIVRVGASLCAATATFSVVTIALTSSLFARSGRSGIDLAPFIATYGLIHLTTAFDDVATATLRTAGWYPFLARFQLGAAMLRVVLTLPLLLPGVTLWSAVAVSIGSQLPASIWLCWSAARAFRDLLPAADTTTPMPSVRSEWRRHAKTLATLSLTDTVKTLALDADPVIVGALGTPTEVGEFKATSTLMMGLHALTVPLYTAFYPDLARAIAARDLEHVRALKRRLTFLGAALGVAAALGTAIVGPWLLRRIYGGALADAAIDIRIMGASMIVMAVHWANPLFTSLGQPLRTTFTIFASLVVKAALMVVYVPTLGSTGAAIGFTAYFAATILFSIVLSRGYESRVVSGSDTGLAGDG